MYFEWKLIIACKKFSRPVTILYKIIINCRSYLSDGFLLKPESR